MSNIFDITRDLAKGARLAAGGAVWLGRSFKRHYNSAKNGVCLLCNNLQPDGHENTFHWGPSGKQDNGTESGTSEQVLALELEGLSTNELLKCREINPETGAPFRDCRYCRLLCEIFDVFFIDEWMSWVTETKNAMPVSFGLMIKQGSPLIVTTTCFIYDKFWKSPRADVEVYWDASLPPHVVEGLPCSGPVGPRQKDVRSEACMAFIKDSVNECCSQHRDCRLPHNPFVPTRLLKVDQGNDLIHLCETHYWKQPVSYVALSHCWGGMKPLELTRPRLDELKTHINWSDLPATFKDAITVAQELKVPYVWIDSLCIIQDDKTDWEKEAARMADVYSRAFIVVTASSSPNPVTPFLGPREEEWHPKTFNFPVSPGITVPIIARKRAVLAAPLDYGLLEPPFTTTWGALKRVGPLYNRGWCFQESYLATRNLHFSPGSIVFECKTHRRGEDQLPPYTVTTPGTRGDLDPALQWRMIVMTFTSRQLTFGSDKMPAIAGAATIMPQAKTSRYLAGLWSETLLLDLMWQVMPWQVLARQKYESLAYDDKEGGPPTWSWASMNWGVVWSPQKLPHMVAKVLSAETTVEGVNPYGKVSAGTIKLQGRLKRCTLKWDQGGIEHECFYKMDNGKTCKPQHYRTDGPLAYEDKPGSYGIMARRGRDGPYWKKFETTAVVFFISSSPILGHVGKQYAGLVLGISPRSPECLERVGAVFFLPKHWYDTAEEATVTVV